MNYNFENLMDVRNFPGLLNVTDRVRRFAEMSIDQLNAEKAKAEKNYITFAEQGKIATANEWKSIECDIETAILIKENPDILDEDTPDITELL